jgi:hypothetical protein
MVTLNQSICALFQVHQDDETLQRVITPFEYTGMGDNVVVRVRKRMHGWQVDDNGEAAFFASMAGGDIEADGITRWLDDGITKPAQYNAEDESIVAEVDNEALIATAIFRVAQASQTLYALATNRAERQSTSDFKERLSETIVAAAEQLKMPLRRDVELSIAGNLTADYVIDAESPLIIIAASSATRLLEAELIYLQYQNTKEKCFVLAVAENQKSVGIKQFERANYYTDKTVSFNPSDLPKLIQSSAQIH